MNFFFFRSCSFPRIAVPVSIICPIELSKSIRFFYLLTTIKFSYTCHTPGIWGVGEKNTFKMSTKHSFWCVGVSFGNSDSDRLKARSHYHRSNKNSAVCRLILFLGTRKRNNFQDRTAFRFFATMKNINQSA